MIKDSGDRTEFETGAKRDMHAGKGRMDLLPWYGIMEVSKHCEEGALKYGEHNVDKGIPLHSLLDSASRHLAKYMVGMDDEDHLRAACWNLLWELNQRVTHVDVREWCMENDISLGQFDRWLYGALRKSDTPSRVKPKEPWPYRVVAGLNRVLEILLDSILEDFI